MLRPALRASLFALLAVACSDISGGGGGRTQVLLTDSPFPYDSIEAVNIYVARIDVSTTGDTTGASPASWITVATPERVFNLLDLQNGSSALLGESDLPAGQYAAVRMVINTSRSSIVRNDGSQATVQWPVAGELALHALVEQPLWITTGDVGNIVIDFDVGRSFLANFGAKDFTFLPWIRAVNDAATGTIQGTLTYAPEASPLVGPENTAIEVYRYCGPLMSCAVAATGRTDAQGRYVIPLLAAGEYTVAAYPPGFPWWRASVGPVTVTMGQSTTVNLVIGPDSAGGGCCDTLPPPPDTINPPPDTIPPPGGGAGPLHHITMTPVAQTVSVGDSISVLATKKDSLDRQIQDFAFFWSISDTTVVRQTWQSGGWILLRALRSGTATITARDTVNLSISGTATVQVR